MYAGVIPRNPYTPNILLVRFLWSQAGLPAENVKYVEFEGERPTSGDCTAIGNILSTAFTAPLSGMYTGETELQTCTVQDMTDDSGAEGAYSIGWTGDGTGDLLPAQCCVLVNHEITRHYRGGHPRSYYPAPLNEAQETISTWTSACVTAFGDAEAAYALACTTGTYSGGSLVNTVNVSYMAGRDWRVDNLVDPITGSVVSGIIRTQRRRLTASSY